MLAIFIVKPRLRRITYYTKPVIDARDPSAPTGGDRAASDARNSGDGGRSGAHRTGSNVKKANELYFCHKDRSNPIYCTLHKPTEDCGTKSTSMDGQAKESTAGTTVVSSALGPTSDEERGGTASVALSDLEQPFDTNLTYVFS